MKTFQKSFCFLLSTLFCLGVAQAAEEEAATLGEVNGTVLVNQGKNYQTAQSGMKLAPNARVFTKDKASAVVTSKQGCATRLGANSLFVVKPVDPCHGGAVAQKLDSTTYAATGGTGSGAAADAGGSWFANTTNQVILGAAGAAVVAGGVVGGLAASGGLDNEDTVNVSPAVAATIANTAVISAGGTAEIAKAAEAVAKAGGDAAAIEAAVLKAGGSPTVAAAAARAFDAGFAAAQAGQDVSSIKKTTEDEAKQAVIDCASPNSPQCQSPT